MGYPNGLLQSRAVFENGKFAIIPPEGLVNNVLPGFENTTMSILGSKRLGARFTDYVVTLHKGGKTTGFAGQEDVQSFVYVIGGKVTAHAGDDKYELTQGGYLYCPPSVQLKFENAQDEDTKLFLYKQKYTPLEGGKKPWVVTGNTNEIKKEIYDNMENVLIQDLLPVDFAFDMNMHILEFKPTGNHPFVETHYQEHGAYLLEGEGIYNLDNKWYPVQKNDYIYMAPYCLQACYAIGRGSISYIYSKDCHRDPEL